MDKQQKKRKSYVDVAKGLLIIMVVVGHYENISRVNFGIENVYIQSFNNLELLWVSWFMPAFFFLTGFCSNFNKALKPFLISNFKTILIPGILITILVRYCDNILNLNFSLKAWSPGFRSLIIKGGAGWFLTALFIAKLIYWYLNNRFAERRIIKLFFTTTLFVIGLFSYNTLTMIPNVWYFKHALLLTLFLALGDSLKGVDIKKNLIMLIGGLNFLSTILLLSFGFSIPVLASVTIIAYSQIPLELFLSITGCFFILYVSLLINNNTILEYLGRNSLVIYLVHFFFYKRLFYINNMFFEYDSWLFSLITIIVIVMLVLLFSVAIAYILNKPKLKFLLGKF